MKRRSGLNFSMIVPNLIYCVVVQSKTRLLVMGLLVCGVFACSKSNTPDTSVSPPVLIDVPPQTPPPATDICAQPQEPGRVTIRRLNRYEYNATVRDLLNDTTKPAEDFPSDDHGYGFDNNADVLSMSPLLFEKYDIATTNLVHTALAAPPVAESIRAEAELLEGTVGRAGNSSWVLWSNGEIGFSHNFPHDGRYRFSVRAWQSAAGPDDAEMEIVLNNQVLDTVTVSGEEAAPQTFTVEQAVSAGNKQFVVRFINDYYMPNDPDPANRDRNLFIDWLNIEGPLDVDPNANPTRIKLMTCSPDDSSWDECAVEILGAFASRAWRRDLTSDEIQRLVALSKVAETEGDTFDAGIGIAFQAILLSPHFLFRVELDDKPNSSESHPVGEFELASRLSYFLWSSTPDDQLLGLARENKLSDPQILTAQVTRMLNDERSVALIENFAGQWLHTKALEDVNPDYAVFPDFDAELLEAMEMETYLTFEDFMHSDRPFLDILDAEFTYLNDRLATHYGLGEIDGKAMIKVSLPEKNSRRGLLSQASILTVTSYPKRTSPVRRGKWILEQLLCAPPPAPPPGVEGLPEQSMPSGTLREQFEQHRADPACAGCHITMDALGFALEHFDGIGAYRTEDRGGYPIDATGDLPDGRSFEGATELSEIIKADKKFAECVSEKLATYALGRGIYPKDDCNIKSIVKSSSSKGGTFEDLAISLVKSEIFTHRQGEAE